MNVLVAGGAGFIGSHLIDRLLADGYSVYCADKLIMGDGNILHLKGNSNFKFQKIDLSDGESVQKLFLSERFDAVYHLAANSDIQKGGEKPNIDFQDTFMSTRNILEGMRTYHVKNMFFSSTSAVYGEMPDIVLNESTGGIMPVSFYGGAKLASEALISSYVSMCDINALVFRFPNVIGPRLTHGVIFDFINKLRCNSDELEILGDGTQCKPYIHVYDLVEVIAKLSKIWPKGEEVYNISVCGEGTGVTKIADIICSEMGLTDVQYKYTGGDRGWKGDVPRFKYDISKILSTGWKPKYSSDEAVRLTVRETLDN